MLLELRTYDFAPGGAPKYLDLFATEGLPLITRHLPLAGYWLSEIGALNRLYHLWVYRDLDDRSARRTRLMADEEWTKGFLPRGMALIGGQMNQLIESEAMSAEARIVFDAADRLHEARAADVPHLRDGWIALSEVPRTDALFTGRVIAGEAVGTTLSVSTDATFPALDLMRPCAFSPL